MTDYKEHKKKIKEMHILAYFQLLLFIIMFFSIFFMYEKIWQMKGELARVRESQIDIESRMTIDTEAIEITPEDIKTSKKLQEIYEKRKRFKK